MHENQLLKAGLHSHNALREENTRLVEHCQRVELHAKEVESNAQQWKSQAGALAEVDRRSQQLIAIAYNQRLLAQNDQLRAKMKASAGERSSGTSEESRAQTELPNAEAAAKEASLTTEASGTKDEPDQGAADGFGQQGPEDPPAATLSGNSSSTIVLTDLPPVPQRSQKPTAPVQSASTGTPAGSGKVHSSPSKPSSTRSPTARAYYNSLAESKCHHCYHEKSKCAYIPGQKCATCEKFGRVCRAVERDGDGEFPLPRATLRQERLKEAKRQAKLPEAHSVRDESGSVVELQEGADETSKLKETKHVLPNKPDTQSVVSQPETRSSQNQDKDDGTSLFIPEPKSASAGGREPSAPVQVPKHFVPAPGRTGNGRIDWAKEAEVRCHACYHSGLKCEYVPGEQCYQCTRTDGGRSRRVCKPVVLFDGVAPIPQHVAKEKRRTERRNESRVELTSGTPATGTASPGDSMPAAKPTLPAVDTLSSLQKDNEVLTAEVKILRTAQKATEDTWIKQISLLEEALAKYSVESISDTPPTCRKCGGTESVGLREVSNGRLHLCHACGLHLARQGKNSEHQQQQHHDQGLREENTRLKAENIALSTEVAALKERLAVVEKAVVGWGVPQNDSGYEENTVDLTGD